MARPATGRVEARPVKGTDDIVFSLRLSYKGTRLRITLGNLSEGWTPAAAERKREDVMGALALGVTLEQLFPAVVAEASADTRESTLRELVEEYNVTRKGARRRPSPPTSGRRATCSSTWATRARRS